MQDPFDLLPRDVADQLLGRINEAAQQITSDLKAFRTRVSPEEPPPIVYHYTSPGGLIGIVKSGELHLTDAFYLNDQSELLYARDLIMRVLYHRLLLAQNDVLRKFIDTGMKVFDPLALGHPTEFRFYVASFCAESNLLSQWRAYGHPGAGFALGFDANALQLFANPPSSNPSAMLHPVVYDRKTQVDIVEFILDCCIERMQADVSMLSDELQRKATMSYWFHKLSMFLIGLLPEFKHPMFQEEREWRFTCARSIAQPRLNLQFREAGRHVVPYFAFDVSSARHGQIRLLPLLEIVHAPTPEPELKKRSIRALLESFGYPENSVATSGSDIPLRTA